MAFRFFGVPHSAVGLGVQASKGSPLYLAGTEESSSVLPGEWSKALANEALSCSVQQAVKLIVLSPVYVAG